MVDGCARQRRVTSESLSGPMRRQEAATCPKKRRQQRQPQTHVAAHRQASLRVTCELRRHADHVEEEGADGDESGAAVDSSRWPTLGWHLFSFQFRDAFRQGEPWTLKIKRQRLRQKTRVGMLLTVPRTSLQDLQTSLQVPVPVPFEDPLLAFFRPSTFPMPSLQSNAGAASLRRE